MATQSLPRTGVTESDTREMVHDLSSVVSGEVRFDKMSRILYSTDASIYQIEPVGVVLPKNAEDVIAVVETASKYGVSVLPRGGGTSLGGQTVGHSIVMDFSKYMNSVIELKPGGEVGAHPAWNSAGRAEPPDP